MLHAIVEKSIEVKLNSGKLRSNSKMSETEIIFRSVIVILGRFARLSGQTSIFCVVFCIEISFGN